jgi:hypothetical protein
MTEKMSDDIFFKNIRVRVRVMVFNATFNNISVLVQRSVLLEEETEENQTC